MSDEITMEAQKLEGYEEVVARFLAMLPIEVRRRGLTPEQLLAGLSFEERVAGIPPEEVVLCLPDEILRGLTESYIAEHPEHVQQKIRQRIGR